MAAQSTSIAAKDNVDVVIVGAGVAGALIAHALSTQKIGVLLLEAGETGRDRRDLVLDWAASAVKRLGTPYIASKPDKIPGPEQPAAGNDIKQARDFYYDQEKSPEKYQSTYERRVGGSTWHWLGHTPRLLPNDFRMKSKYRVGVDWPIGYADLESWYCKAEKAIGVAGDDGEWKNIHGAYRSEPFPMSKIWPSWSDQLFARGLKSVEIEGQSLAVLSTPSARNSEAYDGRPPCAGNASCVPICPIGAKYDASVHVKKAQAQGVDLRERSVAKRIELDQNGNVRGVRYQTWDGEERVVSGRLFVLAANAIETAKLLLLPGGNGSGPGVANSSGMVGRNLMDHLQKKVFGTSPEPLFPFRGPPSTSGIEAFRDGPFREQQAAFRLSLGNDGWSSLGSPYNDVAELVQSEGLFGKELRRRLFDNVSRQARVSCSLEVLPNPDNRVELSDQNDSFGIPRPKIHFATEDYTRVAFSKALEAMSAILRSIGATTHGSLDRNPLNYTGAGHVLGTCRMGFDASTSVVDPDCRSHDHPNLFIVGGSTFPTCGTANPTLTIAALALRAADHVLRILPQFPAKAMV